MCYILLFGMPINRKDTRLPPEFYRGQRYHFVTICCDRRKPYLGERATAQSVLATLEQCAAKRSFQLHAYCLMPDHVHLLVQGMSAPCDLLEFIRVFKLRTAFEFKKSHGARLWEKSYYDHTLRQADAIEDVASYIWQNPVRKKLCAFPSDFPFSGSRTIEWMRRAASESSWSAPWKGKAPI